MSSYKMLNIINVLLVIISLKEDKLVCWVKSLLMSKKVKYKFSDSLWSEIVLAIIIGFPLGFCTLGLY